MRANPERRGGDAESTRAAGPRAAGRWLVAAVVASVGTILIFRCFNAVRYPILHCEDGTEMLAFYLAHPHPGSVLRDYAGYISLLPNAVGYLTARLLPPHLTAYAMVGFSLAMATAALSLFASSRFRFVVPSDRARALVCLIVASVPLGNHALLTNLTYSLWNIFLVALLLLVAPLPRTRSGRVVQGGFLCLAIWSHPMSIVFVPICLVLLLVRRTKPERLRNIGLILVVLLYAWLGIRPAETAGSGGDLATVRASLGYVAHRVIFESIFGNRLRMMLQESHQTWITLRLALCALALLMVAAFPRPRSSGSRQRWSLLALVAFLVGSLTYLAVAGRSMTADSHLVMEWSHRYFYPQQVLFVLAFAILWVDRIPWQSVSAGSRAAVLACWLTYVSYLGGHNAGYFDTSEEQGRATLEFLRAVSVELASADSPDARRGSASRGEGARRLVLERGGRWDIVIEVPPSTSGR